MSFQEQAESLRAKAHLSGARLPVLVGVTALAVAVLAAAGIGAVGALSSEGFSVEKAEEAGEARGAASDNDPAAGEPAVVVHVGGAVAAPGVRELPPGARVQDAVDAAGGFSDDAACDALNLARVLVDGEQVVVPSLEEAEAAATASVQAGDAGTAAAAGKVNINTASAAELDALPGIGPSTAGKIVADREANGPFATVEDLKRVSGIGDKKYADLADSICVG